MKKIFVTRKLLKENEEKLKELFDVKLNVEDKVYSADQIIKETKGFDGILSSVTDPINADTISKLSSTIKIIANGAVGFGNIDIKAARERGITVTNTPDVLTDATADIQILLLLGASRKAYEGRLAAETQNWKWSWDFLLGKQMSNKRLGILGMGRIGRAVAKRAKAFGMEIHYHNRSKLSSDLEDGAIYHKNLKELFAESEFLSINCPATPETTKIINKETLGYLKKNTVVANAARGDVVDDDAMVEALKNGTVFAYGLDVYNGEPKIHPEYLKLKNIFLLPHLGSATKRTRWDMAFRATKNLEETSKKFSIFFGRDPNFIGQSRKLGIDIISFGLNKTNICLISPKRSGIWFETLNNFLKNKGEGIFGINFSSNDFDSDYNHFIKNDLKLSATFKS